MEQALELDYKLALVTEAYLEPCQTSMMEIFCENRLKAVKVLCYLQFLKNTKYAQIVLNHS